MTSLITTGIYLFILIRGDLGDAVVELLRLNELLSTLQFV